ncbi:MAG TPA: hypothetical protein VF267_12455 [Gammaproteobacteria bacterium]
MSIHRWTRGFAAMSLLLPALTASAADPGYASSMQENTGPSFGTSSATSDKAFNPAISLILSGRYASFTDHADTWALPGFQLGGETGERVEGFSLGESELNLRANIDDKFFGAATIALGEDGAAVEEAYLQTLALPDAFTIKAGKFLSDIGYQNRTHPHADEFVDNPLVYDAFLGGRYADAGVQLTWLAPTSTYLQFGTELMSGEGFPAAGRDDHGRGAFSVFMNVGGDVGYSNSWLAGLSFLSADAIERPGTGEGDGPLFTGSSDLWIGSLVWKWSPNGNPRERNLELQTEVFSRSEDGVLDDGGIAGSYDGEQRGYYAQAVYQFARQWRAGLRYDRLETDNRVSGLPPTLLDATAFTPARSSVLLEYANSEFSSVRLQFSHDASSLETGNAVFLQYVLVMGAHGAHTF